MKELRNRFDKDAQFDDLAKAKKYYMPNQEALEYAEEIANAETLEELADVLNRYSDIYGDGSEFYVYEF